MSSALARQSTPPPRQSSSASCICVRRNLPLLVLFLPCAFYIAIAAFWVTRGSTHLTGDEPHFLMLAESLLQDGDLWVENNYQHSSPITQALGGEWTAADLAGHERGYSLHQPALGILILPSYALGGVAGVRLFLALAVGLVLPWLLYTRARAIGVSAGWSVWITLCIALNLPFLAGANQIYADLIGGVIILHAAGLLVDGFRRQEFTPAAQAWLGAECGVLPWLHIRFIAPALVLLAFELWALFRLYPRQNFARRLWPLVVPLSCFALFGVYNWIAFQNPLGPFGADRLVYRPEQSLMILMGLHWDSFQGMFFQAPFLLLGWIGIVPFVRANRVGALCVALVYLAVLVPNTMHLNWYGGASFAGRYAWAAVALWIFPIAYAAKQIRELRLGTFIIGGLGIASLALQALLARLWLTQTILLYNQGVGSPLWAQTDLYTRLLQLNLRAHLLLPSFRNFDNYYALGPNFVWVGSSLLLCGVSVWLMSRKKRGFVLALVGAGILVALGSMLWLMPARLTPLVWEGSQLTGDSGSVRDSARVGNPGNAGLIVRSPVLRTYPDSQYRVTLTYNTGARQVGQYVVVLDGGKRIAVRGPLPLTNGQPGNLTLTVPERGDAARRDHTIEFQLFYNGHGTLAVQHLSIEPISTFAIP